MRNILLSAILIIVMCGCGTIHWPPWNPPDPNPPIEQEFTNSLVFGQWEWIPGSKMCRLDATVDPAITVKVKTDGRYLYFENWGTFSGQGDPWCDFVWALAYTKNGKRYMGMMDYMPKQRPANRHLTNLYDPETKHKFTDGATAEQNIQNYLKEESSLLLYWYNGTVRSKLIPIQKVTP